MLVWTPGSTPTLPYSTPHTTLPHYVVYGGRRDGGTSCMEDGVEVWGYVVYGGRREGFNLNPAHLITHCSHALPPPHYLHTGRAPPPHYLHRTTSTPSSTALPPTHYTRMAWWVQEGRSYGKSGQTTGGCCVGGTQFGRTKLVRLRRGRGKCPRKKFAGGMVVRKRRGHEKNVRRDGSTEATWSWRRM